MSRCTPHIGTQKWEALSASLNERDLDVIPDVVVDIAAKERKDLLLMKRSRETNQVRDT